MKAFYDVRSNKEGVFEYGYVLKAFPDEVNTTLYYFCSFAIII
jgi:hypothetical protein